MNTRTSPKKPLIISFVSQYVELAIHFIGILFLARLLSPRGNRRLLSCGIPHDASPCISRFRCRSLYCPGAGTDNPKDPFRPRRGDHPCMGSRPDPLLEQQPYCRVLPEARNRENSGGDVNQLCSFTCGCGIDSVIASQYAIRENFYCAPGQCMCHVGVAITLAVLDYGAISLAWANLAGILSYGVIAVLLKSEDDAATSPVQKLQRNPIVWQYFQRRHSRKCSGHECARRHYRQSNQLGCCRLFQPRQWTDPDLQNLGNRIAHAVGPGLFFANPQRKGDLAQPYHAAVEYLTVVAWPFFATMGLFALPIVRTLYGPQWDASVPIVQLLCIAGAISMIGTFAGEVMIANGHVRQVTKFQILTSTIRVVAILAMCRHGLAAIAISLIISEICSLGVVSHYLAKATGVRLSGVLRSTLKSAIVTVTSIIMPLVILAFWPPESSPTWALCLPAWPAPCVVGLSDSRLQNIR